MIKSLQKVYPITALIADLDAELETSGGEVTELAQRLTDEIVKMEGGVISLANYHRHLVANANAAKAALAPIVEELEADISAANQRVQWVETIIKRMLPPGPESALCNEQVNIYYTESTAVEIVDHESLPMEFVEVETKAKKRTIEAALKKGEEVPGARLKINYNLQIKHAGPRAEKNARARAKKREQKVIEPTVGEAFDLALKEGSKNETRQ
jgi:hypothetical protein